MFEGKKMGVGYENVDQAVMVAMKIMEARKETVDIHDQVELDMNEAWARDRWISLSRRWLGNKRMNMFSKRCRSRASKRVEEVQVFQRMKPGAGSASG